MVRSQPPRGPSLRLLVQDGSTKASHEPLFSWATAEARAEDAEEASDPGEDQGGAGSRMFITESRWPEETGYNMCFFSLSYIKKIVKP